MGLIMDFLDQLQLKNIYQNDMTMFFQNFAMFFLLIFSIVFSLFTIILFVKKDENKKHNYIFVNKVNSSFKSRVLHKIKKNYIFVLIYFQIVIYMQFLAFVGNVLMTENVFQKQVYKFFALFYSLIFICLFLRKNKLILYFMYFLSIIPYLLAITIFISFLNDYVSPNPLFINLWFIAFFMIFLLISYKVKSILIKNSLLVKWKYIYLTIFLIVITLFSKENLLLILNQDNHYTQNKDLKLKFILMPKDLVILILIIPIIFSLFKINFNNKESKSLESKNEDLLTQNKSLFDYNLSKSQSERDVKIFKNGYKISLLN